MGLQGIQHRQLHAERLSILLALQTGEEGTVEVGVGVGVGVGMGVGVGFGVGVRVLCGSIIKRPS